MEQEREEGPPIVSETRRVRPPIPRAALQRAPRHGEFRVGGVIGTGFRVWARDFVPYMVLTLLVFLPYAAYETWANALEPRVLEEAWYEFGSFVLQQFLGLGVAAMVIHGVFQRLRGRRPSLADCARTGFARILPVAGVALLTGLAIFAPLLPGFVPLAAAYMTDSADEDTALTVGAALLFLLGVIPAMVIAFGLWMTIPVCVVERRGLFASLKRSWSLTKGSKGSICLLVFLFNFLTGIFGAVIGGIGALLFGMEKIWIPILVLVVLSTSLNAVVNAVAYHDLRVAKEGIGTEELAAIFD